MGVIDVKDTIITERGGGWYQLPNGKKVRGWNAVRAAMEQQVTHSDLTGRLSFLKQAGLQYRGNRDVYTTAGYVQPGAETFDHYWALYERDPVAGRIVDMPPDTTWRTPAEVFEGDAEKEQETEFEKQWRELAKRLKVWKQFAHVDKLSRIGKYAVLLIGVREEADKELDKQVEPFKGTENVLYLGTYSQKYATIEMWDQNPQSVRFGLPESYKVNLSSGVEGFSAKSVTVHHSRLIHVAENTLIDDVHGRPVLQRALNPLADLLKVSASTGEAYWQLAARILKGTIDPAATVPEGMIAEMGEALEEMVHDLRRQFVGHGIDLDWLSGNPPEPDKALEVYKQLVSVSCGIPTRMLFGSEQGQLASTQDQATYFGMVNERQEQHAEPNILRAFIDRLIEYGALTKPKEEYTVVWPTLYEESDKDKADANLTRARAAKELTPMGGDPRELIEVDGERNVWLIPQEPGEVPQPAAPVVVEDADALFGEEDE